MWKKDERGIPLSHLPGAVARRDELPALCAGDRPAHALDLARAACRLHTTRQGQRLLALALVAAGRMAEAHQLMEQLLEWHDA